MLAMKNLQTKKQYDLVSDDGYDSKIPLHNEDAFQHGLVFQAKYIGTLDVPRPSSRVEIVAAMRRIRYEFKAKAIKKKKVNIAISTDGVKIVMSKRKKKKQSWAWDETSHLLVMQHPIYRIFYVSHDSNDLKIFSYIARDGSTNVFKCNVFKAYKKTHAMRIVRTIGQAFEVCHKMSVTNAKETEVGNEGGDEKSSEESNSKVVKSPSKLSVRTAPITTSTPKPEASPQRAEEVLIQAQTLLQTVSANPSQAAGTISSPNSPPLDTSLYPSASSPQTLATQHQLQLLRQQLEQQTQQTEVAMSQVSLLTEQLTAETNARVEAQARTHQLLVQNRELLEHINTLVGRLQYLEAKVTGSSQDGLYRSPQAMMLPDRSTPKSGSVAPGLQSLHESGVLSDHGLFENTKLEFTESPDSGHREMSSDSLACSAGNPDSHPWYVNTNSTTSSHVGITRSVSSNGYMPGSMSANNRPELNLPLRPSSNPFTTTTIHGNGYYENVNKQEPELVTPVLLRDAGENQLAHSVAPKLDPPPKVNRKSTRTPVTTPSVTSVTSPDANGNRSVSRASTMSENSFEMHLNQLLEQATLNHNNMTDNIVNEHKELNTLPKPDMDLNKNTVNNLSQESRTSHKSPLIMSQVLHHRPRQESFSDEENTEEVEETDLKKVLGGEELEMFSDLEIFTS